ncbi:MAG: sulfatase-like hydrolase/transferase, partial [Deltaproteobacteria bacterium]|nr:sulfatase-like hydrolase/transferase [Deltaproteobacteria bacterium]
AVAGVVASWPLAALLRRAGRLASVGSVASVAALAAAVPVVHVLSSHRDAVAALDPWAFALAGALLAADLALVTALLVRARRPSPRRGLVPAAALGVAVACALLAAVPARGLGRRQAVMIALASRSLLARRVVGPLQRTLDRDRDGHGVLFGGGDCDDRNPRVYPGAPETPGNGIDESCSGRDAPARVRSARAAPSRSAGAVAERPPSVLFVSIDAVRPDHTTVYGYHRPTTPNIARFAARAARFTNAYAVAPGSLRSFASTFTGRYPGDVTWGRGVDPRYPAVADDNVTLAEELRAAGYATAAFTNTSYFSGTPGFYQGFDVVQDPREFKDDAAPIVRGAVEWIERPRTRPFFAWVHLIDPHAPYGEHNWPQEFGRTELDRYDGEIARADAFAARLLDAADRIERRGDPVLVVVFSDHGEGFNEHGSRYHYYDVHEEAIRVALLVRGPGVAPGDRRALTALLDLHATVLEFARQPLAASTPSRSLVPVLLGRHGGTPPDWRDEVYADAAEYGGGAPTSMALVAPPWKIAFDATRSVWELYNLELDPGEQNNLYDDDPARAAELRARLFDVDARR